MKKISVKTNSFKKCWEHGINTFGSLGDTINCCKAAEARILTMENVPDVDVGCADKSIGMLEMLWRRGIVYPNASKPLNRTECIKIIETLPDFQQEMSLMGDLTLFLGDSIIFTWLLTLRLQDTASSTTGIFLKNIILALEWWYPDESWIKCAEKHCRRNPSRQID